MNDHEDFRRARRHDSRTGAEPGFRLRLARLALAWERLWPALWPATGIAGLFLAVALSGLVPRLDGWMHAALLLAFAAAFAVALFRGLSGLRFPGTQEAIRRLERDSGLSHRPLGALGDVLAGGPADPATAELWRVHRERLLAQIRTLRVRAPHPLLAARDTMGLRAVVGILLFVAATASWGDWRARLSAAVSPRFDAAAPAAAPVLDIWVTPPEYTGLPPVFLKPDAPAALAADAMVAAPAADVTVAAPAAGANPAPAPAPAPTPAVRVPAGSVVLARVSGGTAVPTLDAGGNRTPFEQIEPGSYEATRPVGDGSAITVDQDGAVLGSWPIAVIADQAPTVRLTAPPEAAERGALHLAYEAADDYGIVATGAVIRLDAEADPDIDRTPIALALPRPKPRAREVVGDGYHDLTPHPWAGLPVTIRVEATDGAGQTGTTEEVSVVLPERVFTHPVARAIIEQRRRLTLRPQTDREDVARTLGALSVRPGLFNEDVVVFLGLRTSVARLFLDRSREAAVAVQDLLWDLALRVEDGQLSLAERSLRDAQQALMDALDRDAPDEEIQRLMDELQTAMNEFLDAMEEQLRQAMERGEPMQQLPPQMQGQMLDRQDLQQMMEQMRRMAETGARDAARQMLSQLQNLMENLRAGTMAQMQQGQNPAGEMMQELQELSRRQQELLD
ncbi:TIGR02302 family protein, partial [Arenibaculum sp.]|uniref:TIGR02302 family protein n=1 Tax=Arenibaculum sp. TaxID=2865862 RepID=UPI002E13529B|nr:TIGR02302 family protein [Arenibaculum sp.]